MGTSEPSAISHDQNFKNLILDFLHESLRFFAGAEGQDIPDSAIITPLRQEQTKESLGDAHRELDVPVLVEFPDHRREAIAFIIEEETTPARFSVHRLAHYCLDLSKREELTRIVPVVVFLRSGNPEESLRLGTERATYLAFSYIGCHLARMNALDYVNSENVVARILLPTMGVPAELRVEICVKAMEGLVTLVPNEHLQRKYANFVGMYSGLKLEEKVHLTEVLQSTDWGRHMLGFLDEAKLEGKREGRLEGRQEGLLEGRLAATAQALIRVLTKRGLALSPAQRAKIDACTDDALLDAWFDRALTAASIDEVFAETSAH